MPKTWSHFAATFRKRDIFSYRVARSGASFSPEFEAREAARWANYTWPEFCAMDGEEQSATVAQFRVSNYLESVISKIQADEAKRNARSK